MDEKGRGMDVIKAVRGYLTRMCSEMKGMKVLLLDAHTTSIMSVVLSQTEILQKDVFLVDLLEKKKRQKLSHLNCIIFVHPSSESVQNLVEELRDPKYKEYHIVFNNVTSVVHIERLAESDQGAVVKQVLEYFADYYAINHDLFSLNLPNCIGDHLQSWDIKSFERATQGLISVLLSLKKKPLIRYEKNSEMTKRLATEIQYVMQQEKDLFEFRQSDSPPLLLILDRRNDPVTPLLNQWTYQAMIHELIGIKNNLVNSTENKENKDLKDVVLSVDQDPFFKDSMFLNFGDLGEKIKKYVENYQEKNEKTRKIESISDMKRFVEDYPEFKKMSGNVAKHVALISELSRLIDQGALLDISEVEQELAVNEDHATNLKAIQGFLSNPKISQFNKIRLVLLYTLRYEKSANNETSKLLDALTSQVPVNMISWISSIIRFAGASQRQGDLFQNESIFAKGKSVLKKGLKGVENVYTQHVPLLSRILEDVIRGRLKNDLYPYAETGYFKFDPKNPHKPQDIIVFFVGGATYEEARFVSELNSTSQARIILGGTTIHNSKSFLEEMEEAIKRAH